MRARTHCLPSGRPHTASPADANTLPPHPAPNTRTGVVHLLSAVSGELLEAIDAHEGAVTCMEWCPRTLRVPGAPGPVPVLATSGRDKRVRLWRAPS
jgi:hypothetical protein